MQSVHKCSSMCIYPRFRCIAGQPHWPYYKYYNLILSSSSLHIYIIRVCTSKVKSDLSYFVSHAQLMLPYLIYYYGCEWDVYATWFALSGTKLRNPETSRPRRQYTVPRFREHIFTYFDALVVFLVFLLLLLLCHLY